MSVLMPSRYKYTPPQAVDRNRERIVRATQVLEAFATGFCLRSIKVSLVKDTSAPAFSSSASIWLDENKIGDLTVPANVASLKGLTLHEIAHILLTPREGSELRQWVVESNLFRSFNALEDQRIESFMVAMFPPVQHWLNYTVSKHLLDNKKTLDRAFPLIRGRKYLPVEIRRAIRDAYINQQDVQELSDIIDTYRTLNLASLDEQEQAKALIERFDALVKNLPASDDDPIIVRPTKKGEQGQPLDPDKEYIFEDSDDEYDDDDSDGGTDGDGSDTDGDDGDATDGGSDGADGDAGDSTDGGSASNNPAQPSEGTKGGWDSMPDPNGHEHRDTELESDAGSRPWNKKKQESASAKVDNEPFEDETNLPVTAEGTNLSEVLENLLEDSVIDVMERMASQITEDIDLYSGDVLLEGEELPEPPRANTRDAVPDGKVVTASEAFGAELFRLRGEYDPAWARRTDSGNVNAIRWERGCDWDEAFDRFEMGREDATDIECVVLLDTSYSMNGENLVNANQSMWAIKNALDTINASTTVITFSDKHLLMYGAEEYAGDTYRAMDSNGGTNPLKAIQYAKSVLASSTRAVKLFIVITDGQWDDSEKSEELITSLREAGVLTALAYISNYSGVRLDRIDAHQCEIATNISDTSALFDMAQSLVEVALFRNLTH